MTIEELIAALEKDSGASILEISKGSVKSYGDLAEIVLGERTNNPNYDKDIHPRLQKLLDERWS